MRFAILFFALGIILCACSSPTPIVLIITATPPPPTATPFIIVVTATPEPVIATPIPSPTETRVPTTIVTAPPTGTPTNPPPSPTPRPTNPPPPPPTATPFLPKLVVFDQGGGNMDVFLYGGQTSKFLNFRAVACAPNCNNRPDGRDVNSVLFTVFRRTPQNTLQWIFEHEENNAPYCIFGGSDQCPYLNITDPNTKWPESNTVIANADYVLKVDADGKNGASWHGNASFRIQR
jgi:hypothetical protein